MMLPGRETSRAPGLRALRSLPNLCRLLDRRSSRLAAMDPRLRSVLERGWMPGLFRVAATITSSAKDRSRSPLRRTGKVFARGRANAPNRQWTRGLLRKAFVRADRAPSSLAESELRRSFPRETFFRVATPAAPLASSWPELLDRCSRG